MKRPKNPFLLSGYQSQTYFCDRKDELKILLDHIENERNVVIYSWRRIGKTSLIRYLLSQLEKNKKTETLYVDLLGTRNISEAIQRIAQATYDRFGTTSSGFSSTFLKLLGSLGLELSFDQLTGMPTFNMGLQARNAPETSLNALGNFLSDRKKRVVVALDEFQQIAHYPNENGESAFRSWMQSFPEIRFLFSGSHRNMMASMFTEKNRPFYRSAQLLRLNPIGIEEYRKFISRHFSKNGKSIDDTSITRIHQWARAQTYCIQLVCNRLYGMYDKVTENMLENVYQELIDQESPVFSNYTNLLTDVQWSVISAVAKEEPARNPLSQQFIAKYRLGAASSVSSALTMLQKKELVIKDDGYYLVHDVLLARWLQRI